MAVVLALLAAAANALSSVLQRRAAARAPDSDALSPRLVGDLVRQPVWVLGICSLIAGFLLQGAGLSQGPLAVVEPVLIFELPLTLVLAAPLLGGRMQRRDWVAIAAVTIGLAGLLVAAAPSGGRASGVETGRWVAAGLVAAALIGALVLAGVRTRDDLRAALLGVAAGIGFGVTAALMKAAAARLDHGVAAMFEGWELYAMALCGIGTLFLFNSAVQAGRLLAAQPGVTLSDPVVSVALGVWLFGERVRTGPLIGAELVAVALIVGGIVGVAGSPQLERASGPRSRS